MIPLLAKNISPASYIDVYIMYMYGKQEKMQSVHHMHIYTYMYMYIHIHVNVASVYMCVHGCTRHVPTELYYQEAPVDAQVPCNRVYASKYM